MQLTQETKYPWEGTVRVMLDKVPKRSFSFYLRIPGWATDARISVNGKTTQLATVPGQYVEMHQQWRDGDVIELTLPMPATLIEANPLVEETRNQVAVRRGPVTYCLEKMDLPQGMSMSDVIIPPSANFQPDLIKIGNAEMISLKGEVKWIDNPAFDNQLYRVVADSPPVRRTIRLIPYYAWGNRGISDMTVWMPYGR